MKTRTTQMPVDVFGDDNGLSLVADLPGVRPDDLTVELDKGLLTISGLRSLSWTGEEADPPRLQYRRRFQVPDEIDPDQVTAQLDNGVLTVRLPKAEAHKPRRIPIG